MNFPLRLPEQFLEELKNVVWFDGFRTGCFATGLALITLYLLLLRWQK